VRLSGFKCAAPCKNGETGEKLPLFWLEQLITPGDSCPESSLVLGDVAGTARKERQALLKPG